MASHHPRRNDADRYRDDIEAFDRMLRLLEADEDLDMITLFELQEGTPEHAFWVDRFRVAISHQMALEKSKAEHLGRQLSRLRPNDQIHVMPADDYAAAVVVVVVVVERRPSRDARSRNC
jgi:hypothetical protein